MDTLHLPIRYHTKVGDKHAKNQIKVDCGVGQVYIYNSNLIEEIIIPTVIPGDASVLELETWDSLFEEQ